MNVGWGNICICLIVRCGHTGTGVYTWTRLGGGGEFTRPLSQLGRGGLQARAVASPLKPSLERLSQPGKVYRQNMHEIINPFEGSLSGISSLCIAAEVIDASTRRWFVFDSATFEMSHCTNKAPGAHKQQQHGLQVLCLCYDSERLSVLPDSDLGLYARRDNYERHT